MTVRAKPPEPERPDAQRDHAHDFRSETLRCRVGGAVVPDGLDGGLEVMGGSVRPEAVIAQVRRPDAD